MLNIRVFFHKTGRAKYISHLDTMRCMQRAVVRAELPVWYTEGFNPHIYLTFPLPLSLGYESESETMDLRLLDDDYPLAEVTARLNRALPPDIRVIRTAEPVNKPELIEQAIWSVRLFAKGMTAEALADMFQGFMEQREILVEKRAKKGSRKITKQVDIRPLCELLECRTDGEYAALSLKAAAGIRTNLNPSLLTDAFAAQNGIEKLNTWVCRKRLLLADGSDFI